MVSSICKGKCTNGKSCKRHVKNVLYCFQHVPQIETIICKKKKSFEEEKPELCPVCYYEMNDKTSLNCGHWVHNKCVLKSGKKECPICRKPVKVTGKVKIYKPTTPDTPEEFNIINLLEGDGVLLSILNILSTGGDRRDVREFINSQIYNNL